MAFELKLRRGTTAEHETFKGKLGEVTMDTTKKTLVLHDGIKDGGYPLASSSPTSINQDEEHRFVSDDEKAEWDAKISTDNISDVKGMIGFVGQDTISLTYTANDLTMVIESPTAVYLHGIKYEITQSKIIDLTSETGMFYIGYDPVLAQLYKIEGTPDFANQILVAWVLKNAANNIVWVAKENHQASRNVEAHKLHHLEDGLAWISGGDISCVLNSADDISLSLTSPLIVADEELFFSINNVATPSSPYEQALDKAKLPVLYINSDGEYDQIFNNGVENFLSDGTRAVFNSIDGSGVGSLVTAANDTYICYWLIVTTDMLKPVKLIAGRQEHSTLASAELETFASYDLPIPELKCINKIILHCSDEHSSNAAKVVISKVYAVESKRGFKISYHSELANRNESNAHTIDSITGLRAELDALSEGAGEVELSETPVLGLIHNMTDDTFLRIAKDVNTTRVQGYGEFSTWKSNSSDRQNDNDIGIASPLTKWLDTSPNLPYSSMKRIIVNSSGVEVKDFNANSYSHSDLTEMLVTEQVLVKLKEFHYIDATIESAGKTYKLKAVAKDTFTINLADYDFVSPTITVFNPISGVSSGTVSGTTITSTLHPAFVKADGLLDKRYYGAFPAVEGRSTCGVGIKPSAVSRTTARTQCRAFGTSFNQIDFFLRSAIVLLATIERGSTFLERGGQSLNNKWEGYSWRSGATSNDKDNGLTLSLGNRTGVVLDASNRTIANNYRGIENYHSYLWNWVDGVNINNNTVYLSKVRQDAAVYDDTSLTTNGYFDSGLSVPSGMSQSYLTDLHPGTIIPKATGGSATTKYTDAGWSAGGLMALAVGGLQAYPSLSGLVTWDSYHPASLVAWAFVARSSL